MPRVFVSPENVESGRVRFAADEAHHLARVLRLRPGAILEVVDGTGRIFAVRLEAVGPATAWGTILEEGAAGRHESSCAITLAQGILKGERMTWVIQKATELGVARIVPVETERVVVRLPAGRVGSRRARWERIAREAAKQSGRAVTPVVDAPRMFDEVMLEVSRHAAAWLLWEGGGVPVATAAREAGRPGRVLVLVGPEGGFTSEEVSLARTAGARVVGLGPRTLRAESAGVVIVALCQYLFGDLGAGDEGGSAGERPLAKGSPPGER